MSVSARIPECSFSARIAPMAHQDSRSKPRARPERLNLVAQRARKGVSLMRMCWAVRESEVTGSRERSRVGRAGRHLYWKEDRVSYPFVVRNEQRVIERREVR